MRSSSRGMSLAACCAAVLGVLLGGGCTQRGDPVVTVMLATTDAGTGGAAGQAMQMPPVDAGEPKPPMSCELPQYYNAFSAVVANKCKLEPDDPFVAYLESIKRFAHDHPVPMPGESRTPSICDTMGTPWMIYQDESGQYTLCPAACDSISDAVRTWSAEKEACDMRMAAAAGSAGASADATPPPNL
jgi:hypothetical protein